MATLPQASPTQEFDSTKLYIWVKGLEGKVNNLIREIDVLKNDFIRRANQLNKDFKALSDDLVEVRHEQENINQKMALIINELKQTAGQEEVAVLKRYLEYWNPLNFVTQKDLEKAIENKIAEMKKGKAK